MNHYTFKIAKLNTELRSCKRQLAYLEKHRSAGISLNRYDAILNLIRAVTGETDLTGILDLPPDVFAECVWAYLYRETKHGKRTREDVKRLQFFLDTMMDGGYSLLLQRIKNVKWTRYGEETSEDRMDIGFDRRTVDRMIKQAEKEKKARESR